jgi:AraC-like DNA-binding protein
MAHGFQKQTDGPRIALSGGRAAYVGPGLNLEPHRNLAATIAVALQSPFTLRFLEHDIPDAAATKHIALIPPGSLHHLRASGDMAFIYLDAMSDDLAQLASADLSSAHGPLMDLILNGADPVGVDALCQCLGVRARPAKDERIATVVRLIDQQPQAIESIATAAGIAGMSPSRFQSLFRQTVGMPFRRYRLWRRMAIVLKRVAEGETLTNAAFDAGFASSAHLSATFKAMFGLTPSSLIARGIQIDSDD